MAMLYNGDGPAGKTGGWGSGENGTGATGRGRALIADDDGETVQCRTETALRRRNRKAGTVCGSARPFSPGIPSGGSPGARQIRKGIRDPHELGEK